MRNAANTFTSTISAGAATLVDSNSKLSKYGFTAFDLVFYGITQAKALEINSDTKTFQDAYLTGTGKDTYIPGVIGSTLN